MSHHDGTGLLRRLSGAGFVLQGGAQFFQDRLVTLSTQDFRSAGVVSPGLSAPGTDPERSAELLEDLPIPLRLAHHLTEFAGGVPGHNGLQDLLQAVESAQGAVISVRPAGARLAEHLVNLENTLVEIQVR